MEWSEIFKIFLKLSDHSENHFSCFCRTTVLLPEQTLKKPYIRRTHYNEKKVYILIFPPHKIKSKKF